jgi:hypothetical protein
MSKSGWTRNTKCQFCNEEETILHIFLTWDAAKFVWSGVAKSIGAHKSSYFFLTVFLVVSPVFPC